MRTKFLLALWALFLLLVAFGIHGSSTGVTAGWWAAEKPYKGYLFDVPPPDDPSRDQLIGWRQLLMNTARQIRWDELMNGTPVALSQLSHSPRFPVINTNIGNGQNVLISPHAPVLHITTLARPATWGYFFLGAQRGLAWYWWFRVFACFTVLFLLMKIILKGHTRLAAFGAFWFCASAYVVCWSLWPAYLVLFAALGCLSAYHMLKSEALAIQMTNAVLLGLSLPGFVMALYPPWQVPLGFLMLFLFAGLFIRDRLDLSIKSAWKPRLIALLVALLVAGGLTASFIATCLPDLEIMSNTVYPGRRFSSGGDYSLALLFKGMYNLTTIYEPPAALNNESEASSFYYLFPAVFIALCLSRQLRNSLGLMGWLLVAYLVGMIFFLLVGVPEFVARVTLLSYVPSHRADLAIGLASIILCLYILASVKGAGKEPGSKLETVMPRIAGGAVVIFFLIHGIFLTNKANGVPHIHMVLFISLLTGITSYLMLSGRQALFCALLGIWILATTAFFNPLATNLDHIYESELAKQMIAFNEESKDRPFWVCYGGVFPGMLVSVLGGRSISGIHWPPQLSLWREFDTQRVYTEAYNRFAEVTLEFQEDPNWVRFDNPIEGGLRVRISPLNPTLKAIGARYVLAMGDVQQSILQAGLPVVYRSQTGGFSIFEIQ